MIGVPTIKLLCRFEAETPNPFHAQGGAPLDEVQDSSPYVVSDSRSHSVHPTVDKGVALGGALHPKAA
jgi:hypothetical protein